MKRYVVAVRVFSLGAYALNYYVVEAEDDPEAAEQVEEALGEKGCVVTTRCID